MADELIFETFNEKRFAPSAQAFTNSLYDAQLEKDIRGIPEKLAFKIGEAAAIAGLKAYVLRYWETEFDALRPEKSQKNQRIYTRKDVETLLMIKKLLYRDRFSIEGARVALRRLKKDSKQAQSVGGTMTKMEEIRGDLDELRASISSLRHMFS